MSLQSKVVVFESEGNELVGVLDTASSVGRRGIVMVTGGPQYRVGSHRQFVLLARSLSEQGYPVLRFDYRGMGDSDGELTNFLHCGRDIRRAIRAFEEETGVTEVVLWGLCDGASASLMYVAEEEPVAGIVMINPWVRSEAGLARTYIRYYYIRRLFSRDFVRHVMSGQLRPGRAIRDFLGNLRGAYFSGREDDDGSAGGGDSETQRDFRETMRQGLSGFDGPLLLILSEGDLTAKEFRDYVRDDRHWRKLLGRRSVTEHRLEGADHTFSRQVWRDRVAAWTSDWMRSW